MAIKKMHPYLHAPSIPKVSSKIKRPKSKDFLAKIFWRFVIISLLIIMMLSLI